MKIRERLVDNVAILELSGKLLGGSAGSEEFRVAIKSLLEKGINKVVVDVSEVKRMNSTGLGVLISVLTSLRGNEGDLKLAAINEVMEGILVMTKLDTIFETYETAEGAAQSF